MWPHYPHVAHMWPHVASNAHVSLVIISSIHLRHLNPFAPNLGEVLGGFERVLVIERNLGQLCRLLRAEFLTPAESLGKVQGQPFKVSEIRAGIDAMLRGDKRR